MGALPPDDGGNVDDKNSTPAFGFYHVAELNEKLKVNFADIILATVDEVDSRHKKVWLKGEIQTYTLMDVKFDDLLRCSDKLVQTNKSTLLSVDAVHSYRFDMITLCDLFPDWHSHQVILGRNYKETFCKKCSNPKA